MKSFPIKSALFSVLTVCLFAIQYPLFSADVAQDPGDFQEELNNRDFEALRDFLTSKVKVDVAERCSTLTISGDVRTEWRHMNESCCGTELRGHNSVNIVGRPISRNDFDIEFNLRFDYVFERAWAVAQVRYDNSAGVDDNGHPCGPRGKEDGSTCNGGDCVGKARKCIGDPEGFHGSGRCNDLCLKRAYMGYNFLTDGDSRFDVELGRRGNLYNVFDSNIQFLSRLDGIYAKYETISSGYAEWYLQVAGFVVDEKVNQFAWATEVGALSILGSNFDVIYSFIDWKKRGKNRCQVRNPLGFRYQNSQVILEYNAEVECLKCDWFNGKAQAYSAFLYNHAAGDYFNSEDVNCGKQNIGWYAGVLIGKVRKKGDWSVEIQYQVVQAQSIPDEDVSGIGRGNVLDESFTTCSHRGNTNFKGWRMEGLYAFTDNLTLDTILEWSKADDPRIGGRHNYSKFEMEAIYAF